MTEGFSFSFDAPSAKRVGPRSRIFDVPALFNTSKLADLSLAPHVASIPEGEYEALRVELCPKSCSAQSATLFHRLAPRVQALQTSDSGAALQDIVPGKYYGGLKMWSCAPDVARVVLYGLGTQDANNDASQPRVDYLGSILRACEAEKRAATVLELGCGQSIPSLAVLHRLLRAHDAVSTPVSLLLHDYNAEVLDAVTIPNIVFNAKDFKDRSHNISIGLCAGDWDALEPASVPGGADLIIGADVTFDVAATEKVLDCIARLLRVGGLAIIGTKRFYFGTGGGVQEMQDAIQTQQLPLVMTETVSMEDGNMPRVVVVLQRRV